MQSALFCVCNKFFCTIRLLLFYHRGTIMNSIPCPLSRWIRLNRGTVLGRQARLQPGQPERKEFMARKYELPHMGGATISGNLTARLIDELREGEYATCTRLPAELELAERFGVSRSVIRDVLANLEHAGFIKRGRGIGTIIHRDIVELPGRLDIKLEYYELVRGAGYTPSSDSLRLYEAPADEVLAERLAVDVGSTLLVCEKRILASGRPVIYSIDHLPQRLFAGVDYRALDWGGPVFDLLEQHCGVLVDTDIAKISATNATPWIREMLQAAPEEALLFVDEVGYYKLSRPILQTYGYYTNFFGFTMLRKKI